MCPLKAIGRRSFSSRMPTSALWFFSQTCANMRRLYAISKWSSGVFGCTYTTGTRIRLGSSGLKSGSISCGSTSRKFASLTTASVFSSVILFRYWLKAPCVQPSFFAASTWFISNLVFFSSHRRRRFRTAFGSCVPTIVSS